jgi:hypothetical protein
MAPADVHPNMSNDPFAAFGAAPEQPAPSAQPQLMQNGNDDPWAAMNGASQTMQPPAQQSVLNECADPWASMNGQAVPNGMPPAMMPPHQPPAPMMEQMQNNGINDPWASDANDQPQAAMPPQLPTMAPPVQNTPFANMNGSAPPEAAAAAVMQQHPVMYQQAPADPWNQQPVAPNMMAPNQQPMMSPQMMQHQESVPSTVVCNGAEASPPSPIGDQSVLGNQASNNAPEVPVFDQQPMMMMPAIQEQPPNANPFDMQPAGQVQQLNVQMPLQEQPQMNAPVNPFGEVDLTGQMNNLSMQNGATYGMQPVENQGAMNGMSNGVPPMPPNGMPPPPPSSQPPAPPSEPPMPPQQPFGMEQQAPLSPVDPFAVYSPVVSPGVALSPQFNDPFGYAFSPMTSPTEGQKANLAMPVTVPEMPYMNGSLNSSTGGGVDPFGSQQAMVPSNADNNDPFGVFGGGSAPATESDPFGASMVNETAVVQSNQVVDDPFGIFGSPTPVQQQPASQSSAAPLAAAQDPWAAAGFNELPQTSLLSVTSDDEGSEAPVELDTNGLPKQGDYYEARINARSLGAMFYTARDLENTLLYHMPTNVIDSMKSRPIVAYVAENSAAYNSGVHLGHCILSVNGTEVSNPDECADVIRNASRPMNIRGYVMPELEVTLAEGKHMVKYDKKDIGAPPTKMEWKEKYVVVGGIVAKPWVMNMYRSKVRVLFVMGTV